MYPLESIGKKSIVGNWKGMKIKRGEGIVSRGPSFREEIEIISSRIIFLSAENYFGQNIESCSLPRIKDTIICIFLDLSMILDKLSIKISIAFK